MKYSDTSDGKKKIALKSSVNQSNNREKSNKTYCIFIIWFKKNMNSDNLFKRGNNKNKII